MAEEERDKGEGELELAKFPTLAHSHGRMLSHIRSPADAQKFWFFLVAYSSDAHSG